MSIRKKILATSIGPVLVLGVITLLFMLTMVKSSLMDEVQDALKGTAAATLATLFSRKLPCDSYFIHA